MSEFSCHVYYKYLVKYDYPPYGIEFSKKKSFISSKSSCPPVPLPTLADAASGTEGNNKKGNALTSEGPAPYIGDILEDPELLWTEDVWTEAREQEAHDKLSNQGGVLSHYWKTQYESKAGSYWHKFYKRNTDKFYKDRHYLHLVFPELVNGFVANGHGPDTGANSVESTPLYLLEVGCGVGNAVLPLIELNPNIHVVAMDFAQSAIEILNKHPFAHSCVDHLPTRCLDEPDLGDRYLLSTSVSTSTSTSAPEGRDTGDELNSSCVRNKRVRTAVRCVVKDPLPVPNGSMDLALCMFVLSAISPQEQLVALNKISDSLKPGGKLLIRDYGRYDEAQLRFKKGSKLSENFYVRQDGTCSYFFDLPELHAICAKVGLALEESYYIRRQYANRQQQVARRRVWVHAKFIKIA